MGAVAVAVASGSDNSITIKDFDSKHQHVYKPYCWHHQLTLPN
jgi:hypothetical protein